MRGEVTSVLSLERRYHILSRVSAANEGDKTRAIKRDKKTIKRENDKR